MTAPRVLLLEAAGPESMALAATAADRGYQVHSATQPATQLTYSPDLNTLLSGCVLTDFSRPDTAIRDIVEYARRTGVAALLTVNEYLTPLLARACAALGLPGNDPARADAARNKAAMHRAFARHGVTAPTTLVVDDEDQLRRLLAAGRIAFPCVIKPADGAGSTGVTIAHTAAAAIPAWHAARATQRMYGMAGDRRVLVQDYVAGTEYSIESLTQHGRTTHLCATAKTVTLGAYPVEVGHSLPAAMPPAAEKAVHHQVERAIAAAGIRNGASHTEMMLTPDGHCTVIEIGARIGAGHIGALIQHALGIDPWTALWDIALGQPADLTATRHDHATVRFLTTPHTGHLLAVTGLPEPGPHIPQVRLRAAIGDQVEPTRANRSRLGHLIVTGPDATAVDRHAERLLARITIHIAPSPSPRRSPARPHRPRRMTDDRSLRPRTPLPRTRTGSDNRGGRVRRPVPRRGSPPRVQPRLPSRRPRTAPGRRALLLPVRRPAAPHRRRPGPHRGQHPGRPRMRTRWPRPVAGPHRPRPTGRHRLLTRRRRPSPTPCHHPGSRRPRPLRGR